MNTGIKKTVVTALVVLAVGCARAEKTSPPVLATVDGIPITLPQFRKKLQSLRPDFETLSGQGPSEEAKIDLLSRMIQDEMYLSEARRLKILAAPGEVDERLRKESSGYGKSFGGMLKQEGMTIADYRKEAEKDIIIEKLLSSQVYSRVLVTRAQAEAYCRDNSKKFWKGKELHVRQIVVESPREAREILSEIKHGADFAALARKWSLSPDAANGGDLGWIERGGMPPEFESAIWRLKKGSTSVIIKTLYGYHIFKVEGLRKAGPPSPREAEAIAVKTLSRAMGEELFRKWNSRLQARTKVHVNYSLLGRI
ncbi:MAG: peptidylprolyl isomerase [Nitrospirota bacterium]